MVHRFFEDNQRSVIYARNAAKYKRQEHILRAKSFPRQPNISSRDHVCHQKSWARGMTWDVHLDSQSSDLSRYVQFFLSFFLPFFLSFFLLTQGVILTKLLTCSNSNLLRNRVKDYLGCAGWTQKYQRETKGVKTGLCQIRAGARLNPYSLVKLFQDIAHVLFRVNGAPTAQGRQRMNATKTPHVTQYDEFEFSSWPGFQQGCSRLLVSKAKQSKTGRYIFSSFRNVRQ